MTQKQVIRIGHSPDADDAFMFYGFHENAIELNGLVIEHIIQDIQTLNEHASSNDPYEVTALSLATYLKAKNTYELLEAGTSVGNRYGPKLISKTLSSIDEIFGKTIALPGEGTTTTLIAQKLLPGFIPIFVNFDEIFEFLEQGHADAGIIIHEGQLTYQEYGFNLISDLGELFYHNFQLPLPLGVNCIRRDLPETIKKTVQSAYLESIHYALNNRSRAIDYALQYGRGIDKSKADTFIGMYVNQDSLSLNDDLKKAIDVIENEL